MDLEVDMVLRNKQHQHMCELQAEAAKTAKHPQCGESKEQIVLLPPQFKKAQSWLQTASKIGICS